VTDVVGCDGFRDELRCIILEDKLTLLEQLAAAGGRMIEAMSVVQPRLADAGSLAACHEHCSALLPNLRGRV